MLANSRMYAEFAQKNLDVVHEGLGNSASASETLAFAQIQAQLAIARGQELANMIAYQRSLADFAREVTPGGPEHLKAIELVKELTVRIAEGLDL